MCDVSCRANATRETRRDEMGGGEQPGNSNSRSEKTAATRVPVARSPSASASAESGCDATRGDATCEEPRRALLDQRSSAALMSGGERDAHAPDALTLDVCHLPRRDVDGEGDAHEARERSTPTPRVRAVVVGGRADLWSHTQTRQSEESKGSTANEEHCESAR